MVTLIAAVIVFALIAALLAILLRKLIAPATVTACDPAWLEEFSIQKYRPMMRLLSEDDYEFLSTQSGYDPKIARKLRMERRRIFRSYLSNLVRDFDRLHLAARMALVYSAEDRPELASKLMKQRLLFSFAVCSVEARLLLHTAGLGTVDVHGLLGTLDGIHAEISGLMPATSSVA
jgi:hypothetical protein